MPATDGDDEENLAAALVAELTRARQRGLDGLDRAGHGQQPVVAPILERLARHYAGGGRQTDRIPLIRKLLRDALFAWEADGHRDEARWVADLFFATDGGSPGRRSPGELLAAAQGHLNDDALRRKRQEHFQRFATYLIAFVAAQQPAPRRRWMRWLLVGVALLVVGVTGLLVLRPASPPPGAKGPDGRLLTFRFDDLGGGNRVIRVFPGVHDDLVPNGTFNSGDVVPAVCQTTGQLVRSQPGLGERPRESNVWVRIVGSPGQTQYARLTYGDMAPEDLAALPQCRAGP